VASRCFRSTELTALEDGGSTQSLEKRFMEQLHVVQHRSWIQIEQCESTQEKDDR